MKVTKSFGIVSTFLVTISLLGCGEDGFDLSGIFTSEKPDVVLIVVDDLNDWVGSLNGHPQSLTPNMDSLAGQGMLFTNAHANAPQCYPSRQSFLSGRYPKSTGIYFNQTIRPPFFGTQPMEGKTSNSEHEAIFIHRHFLNNDYRVVSGGKITNFSRPDPDLDSYLPVQMSPSEDSTFTNDRRNLWGDGGPQALKDEETGDFKVAEWAINEWNTPSDKPLFMSVGFYRPHRPQNVPEKYFDRFPTEETTLPALPDGDDWEDMPPYARALARSHAHKEFHEGGFSDHEKILKMGGEEEWKYMVGAYLANVNYVDAQIGLLLEALSENPRDRETVIVLTSDHGWNLGEKNHWAKAAIWYNTTHVPFIVVAPGITTAGTSNGQPISLVDIYPTLTELAGLETPVHVEGRSLIPLIEDADRKRPYAFLSYGPENTAVQTESMRYIRYEDGSEELYDHADDPNEWTNLAGHNEYRRIKESLKAKALQFQSE